MYIEKRNVIIAAALVLLVGGFFLFSPKKSIAPEDVATTTDSGKDTQIIDPSTSDVVAPPVTAPKTTTATSKPSAPKPAAPSVPQTGKMYKEFVQPTGFSNTGALGLLNTDAFTLGQFVGKRVILLNFWTTSASNALRAFPYLNAWQIKYKDKGLLIVSIHTPRFTYEHSKSTVDAALYTHNVIHPVVHDNNYGTLNAYGNSVWPHQYLIDINGRVVYDHVGEGGYQAEELKIQELLAARAQKLGLPQESYTPYATPKDAVLVDLSRLKSPETYLGSARNGTLGNGTPYRDGSQDLVYPATFLGNAPYLSKSWSFAKEYARNLVADAGLHYEYDAKIVQAVLNAQQLTRVKVLRDGVPLTTENAGKDIRFEKGDSYFYVSGVRIYEIVNDKAGYSAHALELLIENSGLEVYPITFG